MAISKSSISFKNAVITFEEDKIIITEYKKDDTKVYDLVKELKTFENVEGISLTIAKDSEIPTMVEEEE